MAGPGRVGPAIYHPEKQTLHLTDEGNVESPRDVHLLKRSHGLFKPERVHPVLDQFPELSPKTARTRRIRSPTRVNLGTMGSRRQMSRTGRQDNAT